MEFPHCVCQFLGGQRPGVIRSRNGEDGICVFFCFLDDFAVIFITEHERMCTQCHDHVVLDINIICI